MIQRTGHVYETGKSSSDGEVVRSPARMQSMDRNCSYYGIQKRKIIKISVRENGHLSKTIVLRNQVIWETVTCEKSCEPRARTALVARKKTKVLFSCARTVFLDLLGV